MAIKHGLGTYGNAVGTVTPEDHKLAQAGLIVKDTTGKARPGLFWEGNETIVTGKANMSYDVARFTAVTSRGATSGAVLLANDGVVNVVTTAAPGSNSRIDIVYVWQREFSLDGTDSNPVIGVAQGTAAASPVAPSLSGFPGAVELARILVPAGVTATNSGTTITQTAPFTAAAGGVVHFRNSTEMDAETTLPIGTLAEVAGAQYVYNGSAWSARVRRAILQRTTPQSIPTGTTTVITYDGTDLVNTLGSAFTIVRGTGLLTCVTAGTYRVQGIGNYAYNATGIRQLFIDKAVAATPTTFVAQSAVMPPLVTASGVPTGMVAETFVTFAVGDVLRLSTAQSSGGALNMLTAFLTVESVV